MGRPNKAFDGAERKGREARAAGLPRTKNPYGDNRTWYGGVTFSRAFRTAWRDGWDKEDKRLATQIGDRTR